MKDAEIEIALAETPPVWVIEELSNHNLSVPRGLDRCWKFRGYMRAGYLDWMVPCHCAPAGPKIHCGRFPSSRGNIYFIGICHRCGVVHWLEEDPKL